VPIVGKKKRRNQWQRKWKEHCIVEYHYLENISAQPEYKLI